MFLKNHKGVKKDPTRRLRMQPPSQDRNVVVPRSLLLGQHGVPLRRHPLLLALASSLVLRTLGVHLLLEPGLTGLLSLGTVDLYWNPVLVESNKNHLVWQKADLLSLQETTGRNPERGATYVLNQGALVLEGVTLAQLVELVVQVLVDLAAGTVLDQEAAEDAEATHPEDLRGHTGVGGTLALTVAAMTALAAGEVQLTGAGARVLGHGLADNEAIGDELADRLARVGVGDLVLLVGVEPDLALAAADDRRGQALLSSEVAPIGEEKHSLARLALQIGIAPHVGDVFEMAFSMGAGMGLMGGESPINPPHPMAVHRKEPDCTGKHVS